MGLSSTRGFAGGAAAAAGSFMDRKRKGAVASGAPVLLRELQDVGARRDVRDEAHIRPAREAEG